MHTHLYMNLHLTCINPVCCLSPTVSRRGAERNDEKVKEVKSKYQRDLDQLKAELKSLKAIRKEHAKAMKKNVSKQCRKM